MSDVEKLSSIGEEIAGELTQALSGLLGREVSVGFSQVSDTDTMSVASALDGPFLFSALKGSGGVDGAALMLTKEKDSSIIADLLIGQDGTAAPEKMTELHLSAFGEVVHQITEAFSKGAKKLAGSKALWEVADTNSVDPSNAAQKLSQLGPSLTVFSFGLFIQDLLSSDLLFCLPEAVAAKVA